jgi:hypothetical protein
MVAMTDIVRDDGRPLGLIDIRKRGDHTIACVDANEELIQLTERQLAAAEEAYRLDPSEANQRRIMKAWSAVRRARGEDDANPLSSFRPNPPPVDR